MKVIKMSVLLIKTMLKSIALCEKPKGQLTEVQNYALTPPPSPPAHRPPPTTSNCGCRETELLEGMAGTGRSTAELKLSVSRLLPKDEKNVSQVSSL